MVSNCQQKKGLKGLNKVSHCGARQARQNGLLNRGLLGDPEQKADVCSANGTKNEGLLGGPSCEDPSKGLGASGHRMLSHLN